MHAMTLEEKLGCRIAEQRRLVGLTQAELAEKLNMATESVSRMETGTAMPSLARIDAVAGALGVELIQLFRFRPEPTPVELAVDRLVWLVSRRSIEDVELVIEIATKMFKHMQQAAQRAATR